MASWAQLRASIRASEQQTEVAFRSYSTFAQDAVAAASDTERKLEAEIADLLEGRQGNIDGLQRVLDGDSIAGGPGSGSGAKLHHLQRHKEVLREHQTEFSRIRSNIQHSRNQANLLTSIKEDVNQYRTGSRQGQRSEEDYMLQERNRLDHSHHMADSVLAQAYATRDEFGQQRQLLSNVNRRIMNTASKIPGLNIVIAKINTRKKRDSVIMASLISTCIILVFYFR